MKKFKNFFKGLKVDAKSMMATLAVALPSASMLGVSAADSFATNVTADPDTLFSSVLNIIYRIFRYIGIFLLAWSIGMLVLAFKNEDADSKSRAMMMAVVSIVLVGIPSIIKGVLGLSGGNAPGDVT